MPRPWQLELAPDIENKLLQSIVGFRIVSTAVRGAWKLHQNHPVDRRKKVTAALRERGSDDENAIADLIDRTMT